MPIDWVAILFLVLFLAPPGMYPLLQVILGCDLVRACRAGTRLGEKDRWLSAVSLAAIPALALLAAAQHPSVVWMGPREPAWFAEVHRCAARFAIVPTWLLASLVLGWALWRPRAAHASVLGLLAAATLAAISALYALLVAGSYLARPMPVGTGPFGWLEAILALTMFLIPAAPCVNLALLAAYYWRQQRLRGHLPEAFGRRTAGTTTYGRLP